jgi:pSer/pThr/pTyr-binding forkhead associated (FHA) protein
LIKGLPSQTYYIAEQCVSLGRTPSNDIHIPAEGVSRTHARIVRKGVEYYIADLQSMNGTSVNGKRIKEETRLQHEDVIGLGSAVALRFDSPRIRG